MGYRLRDVIDGIDYGDLQKLKADLTNVGLYLRKFVDQKIAEHERKHERICAGCQTTIDPYSTTNYTLIFGPDDLKRRATFCALDCLKYFISSREAQKNQNRKAAQQTLPPDPERNDKDHFEFEDI
ncbi:hypothetical protein HY772_08770 [Candidatus Woesearchaeota archaeon]|nr:hypothetical protein [Candidatus Woesearchaeota archaeon]